MANNNYQRKGSTSNTQVGKIFEDTIFNFMKENNIVLENQKKIEIGINKKKKHAFDFGNEKIIIECKAHTWTESVNSPSAKLKNWSDAMFSFYIAPKKYKKIFFVEMNYNQKNCKTLLEYFIEHYFYLIPEDVILVDYYTHNNNYEVYVYDDIDKIHMRKDKSDLWNYINS